MQTVPRRAIRALANGIKKVSSKAQAYVRKAVRGFLSSNPDASVAEVRDYSIRAVEEAARLYGDAAATLEVQLYDSTVAGKLAGAPDGVLYDGPDNHAIERGVRYQAGKLVNGDAEAFEVGLEQLVDYHVRSAAMKTGIQNVMRANGENVISTGVENATKASRATRGGKVRYARVPTGLETCTYCVMLASRGFVYKSDESAGHANHRGCNCLIVPGIQGQTEVEGYSPRDLRELWRAYQEIDGRLPQDEEGEILTGTSKERALRAMKREALQEILGRDTFDAE